jgi:hypothetical protein
VPISFSNPPVPKEHTAMAALSAAQTELEAVRDRIGEAAYEAIRAGLAEAEALRSAPGRDATATTRARSHEEFRRQPHLDEAQAAPAAARAPRREQQPEPPRRMVTGAMTLGH